jgi:pimeloyl-ACP methyl ester carboxylesterase
VPFATAPDGVRLYYEVHGTGEPLLLVSGQAGDHTFWDGLPDDFSAQHRVIVYDHRGTGRSDKPEQPPYSTRGFARDAIAILDHLGIGRAHAYGVSMGGRICQWLGIDHADRIGALVLGCTTPGNAHGVRRPAAIDKAMASRDQSAVLDAFVSPEWLAAHPEFRATLLAASAPQIPMHALQLHYAASEGHDAWDWLPQIAAPTLVIHGSDDQLNMTANATLLAQRIPGAQLYLVKGARHFYFFEFRAEASALIQQFLASHPLVG